MVLFIQIVRTCLYQTALTGIGILGWLVFSGPAAAVAALCGALTVVLPGLLHGCLLAAPPARGNAQAAWVAFLAGAALKWLLTGTLFVLAIAILKVDFLPLMSVYIAGLTGYGIALVRVTPARRGSLQALLSR